MLTTAEGKVFGGNHHAGIVELGKPRREMIGAPPGCLPNGVAMLPTREPAFGSADLKTVYLGNLARPRPDLDLSLADRRRRTGAVALLAKVPTAAPAEARWPRAPKQPAARDL